MSISYKTSVATGSDLGVPGRLFVNATFRVCELNQLHFKKAL